MPNVLAFSGSLRKDSYNTKLVNVAADAAEHAGASVTRINLRDYPMPLFDEDLEAASGMPAEARAFKEHLITSDGVLIASPEYNGSMSGALKNAIDWATRVEEGEEPLIAFKHKVCGLLSASPGGLGGIRGLLHARPVLGNIMMHVVPEQFCLAKAHEAFADDGSIKDAGAAHATASVGRAVTLASKALRDSQ